MERRGEDWLGGREEEGWWGGRGKGGGTGISSSCQRSRDLGFITGHNNRRHILHGWCEIGHAFYKRINVHSQLRNIKKS